MRERDRESVQAFTHGATTPTATSTVSQGRSTRALLHGCERMISLSPFRRKENSPRRHGNRPCPRIAKSASQRQLVRVEYQGISRR